MFSTFVKCIFGVGFIVLLQFQVYAQKTGLLHNGYCELSLEKDYWSVKHLLESRPSEGYEKNVRKDQLLYTVKLTEKKYHDILGVEVHSIEVKFENQKIIEILILLENSKKNIHLIKAALKKEFGLFPCHTSGSEELFNCQINSAEDLTRFQFYTYDHTGQFPVNGFICIRYYRSSQLASE